MADVFGFDLKRPPFKFVGISKDGSIQLEKTEHWETSKSNPNLEECRADDKGTIFYDRKRL